MILTQLEKFRQDIYNSLGKAKDAVFELMDAVLTSPSIPSFVSLSQSPVFRRQWSSIYAALHDSRPPKRKLMKLLVQEVKTDEQAFLAGDNSFWGRPEAKTLKERTFHGERGGSIGIGQSYSTLALEVEDPKVGRVKVMRWSGFHFLQSPNRAMEIIRVEVLQPVGRNRQFQPLWLAWLGQTMPALETLWHKYLRRFTLEHWYRFVKQRLYWTQPQLSSTQSAERWSDLMPLLTWQLWLARAACIDSPLPWQSTQDTLSPGRVAQAFPLILATIGTPAQPPKTRGKSPGRIQGHQPPPRPRYPTVKKHSSKKPKSEESLKNADLTAA
jgi:hypothetical protein